MSLPHSDRQAFPAADPEWSLICRAVVDYAHERGTELKGEIDWQRLLNLGTRHCLLSLLATQLVKDAAANRLPEAVKEALVAARRRNLEQVLRMVAELQKLEQQLQSADIDYRIIKGLPLAARAYHDVIDRHAGDIDLLLMNPAAIQQTHDLLLANGYQVQNAHALYGPGLQKLYFRLRKDNAYTSQDGQLIIEVHWPSESVPAFPESLINAFRQENSELVECLGQQFRQPAAQELCDYLVWHGARAQWHRLKWLVDIYLLLQQAPVAATRVERRTIDATSWRLALQLLERLFQYQPGFAHPPPPAGLEATCLRALQAPDRLPGYRRFFATLRLRRQWSWYRLVLRQHAIKLSDYRGLAWPPWAVYTTFWAVRPVSWLYRRLKGEGSHG